MKELIEFKQWLTTLGYSKQRIKQYPRAVERLLEWSGTNQIQLIDLNAPLGYKRFLMGKEYAPAYINAQITAWRTFSRFYYHYYRFNLPTSQLQYVKIVQQDKTVISVEEMQALYAVTSNSKYGLRDKVMLGLCYGCGLRRNEAMSLLVTDIDLKNRLVHVRHTKNNKERLVPIPKRVCEDITNYLKHGRPLLQKHVKHQRELFLGYRGKVITAQVYEKRIKVLVLQTRNAELIVKAPTLHTLRHSIATHLLQAGMSIEHVSQFLGHSSLTAKQVYTHINDLSNEKRRI